MTREEEKTFLMRLKLKERRNNIMTYKKCACHSEKFMGI